MSERDEVQGVLKVEHKTYQMVSTLSSIISRFAIHLCGKKNG